NISVTGTGNALSFAQAITLTDNITLTSTNGAVSFAKVVDTATSSAARSLTVTAGSGGVTFTEAVGATKALADVTVNSTGLTRLGSSVGAASLTTNAGGSVELNGNVTTSGAQTFNENVVLTSNVTLRGASISIQGDVDSDATTARSLAIFATDFALSGGFGATRRLLDLAIDAVNGISLNGAITTDGTQTYNGNVTLTGNTTLVGTDITLNQTVKSLGAARALTVTGSGTTTFGGTVGVGAAGSALASLTVNGAVTGTTLLKGGFVTTTGAQDFRNALTLGADTVLTTTNGDVSFGTTVNSSEALSRLSTPAPAALTITAGSGAVTFTGIVGGVSYASATPATTGAVGAVTVNSSGLTKFGSSVAAASLTTDAGGSVELFGNVTTTGGTQTYGDAVALKSDMVVTGATVSFLAAVTGETHALTITGDAVLGNGDVTDTVTGVTTLNVSGASSIGASLIDTASSQTYTGAITLTADAVLKGVGLELGGSVDGAKALTLTDSGTTKISGAVGVGTSLTSLEVKGGGTTQLAGGSIKTNGTQTYSNAVSLLNNTTLIGSTVSTGSTLTGLDGSTKRSLTVTGAATFGDGTGADSITDLTTLSVSGNAALNLAAITTSGTQTYSGNVSLAKAVSLTTTNNNIGITGTLNGGFDFTATVGSANVTLTGAVGGSTPLGAILLSSSGQMTFGSSVAATSLTTNTNGVVRLGGNVATTGAQTYDDAIVLTNNVVLSGTDITLTRTVNSDGTARALTVTGSGVTTFGGIVGGTAALASLAVNGAGTTLLNAGAVTTVGAQSFGNAVTLGVNTALVTTLNGNSSVTFGSTLNSSEALSRLSTPAPATLSITAGAAHAVFLSGIVGGASYAGTGGAQTTTGALGGVTISAGLTSFEAAFAAASVVTSGTSIVLDGNITTTGIQTYNGDVFVRRDTVLTGTDIALNQKVDSDSGSARALTVTGSGTTTFGGAVGAFRALASLTVSGNGSTTLLNGGSVKTTGAQSFGNALTLGANAVLTATNADGAVSFDKVVDSATSSAARGLTVTAGSGGVTFSEALGGTNSLAGVTVNSSGLTKFGSSVAAASVTTDAGGTVELFGNVTTTGGTQTYGDAVALKSDMVVTGSTVSFLDAVTGGAKALTVTGNAVLGNGDVADTVTGVTTLSVSGTSSVGASLIDTSSSQTYTGAITLTRNAELKGVGLKLLGDVDGARALILTDSGTTEINGAVGAGTGTALTSLEVKGSGAVKLAGGTIKTSGTQTYSKAVALGANTTLEASTVSTGSTLTGLGGSTNYSLTVTGAATFGDGTGADSITDLTTLSVSGNAALNLAAITTSGTQTYSGNVSLAQAVSLTTTNNNIGITGTLNGGFDFTATVGSANVTLTGVVGGSTPLGAILLSSRGQMTFGSSVAATSLKTNTNGVVRLGGNVATTGAQTYDDAIVLTNNVVLSGTDITLTRTVNSDGTARALTVTGSGVTTFGGIVGGTAALASLAVNGAGTTLLNAGAVTTVGAQSFGNAVTLGVNTALVTTNSNVALSSTLNSLASLGAPATLSITAGTGDITLGGIVGGATGGALGAVTLVSARDVGINAALTATSLTQQAGTGITTIGGVATLAGALGFTGGNLAINAAVGAGGAVSFAGSALTVSAAVTSGGAVTVANTGTFTTSATGDISATGAFTQSGAGSNILAGDITSGGNIALARGTVLTGDVAIVTTNASGTIDLAGVNSDGAGAAKSLLLRSPGALIIDGAIGGTQALGTIWIEAAGVSQGVQTTGADGPIISNTGFAVKAAKLAITSSGLVDLIHPDNIVPLVAAAISSDAGYRFTNYSSGGVTIDTIVNPFDANVSLAGLKASGATNTSSASFVVGGLLTQTNGAVIDLGGKLTVNAQPNTRKDVTFNNSGTGSTGTVLGNTLVAGDFNLVSVGNATQAADINANNQDGYLQVGGSFNLTGGGTFIQGDSALNVFGFGAGTQQDNTISLNGVITLSIVGGKLFAASSLATYSEGANSSCLTGCASVDLVTVTTNGSGTVTTVNDITVISQAGGKSIVSSGVNPGASVTLSQVNKVRGAVSIMTAGAYVDQGSAVATGIKAENALALNNKLSFTVQQSDANSTSSVAGRGALNLGADNSFGGTIAANAFGLPVTIKNTQALEIGSVQGSTVTITTTAGGVTQAANSAVSTDNLILSSAGAVTLTNTNSIGVLRASSGGDFSLKSGRALTIGDSTAGVTSTGAVTLQTSAGNLTLAKAITSGGNITLASAGNFINNAGASALSAGASGVWRVWSKDPAFDTLGGLSPGFKQYGATFGTTSAQGAANLNGVLYSRDALVSVALTGNVTKVYDSTDSVTLTGGDSVVYVVTGAIGTDVVNVSSANLNFDTVNVLRDSNNAVLSTKSVIATNVTFSAAGSSATNAIPVYGYTLNPTGQASGAIGTITPYAVSLTGSRVYDATANIDASLLTIGQRVGTETLTISGVGILQDPAGALRAKDVGTAKAFDVGSLTLVDAGSGSNAGLASNYALTGSRTATITRAAISSVSGITATNKTYDGNDTATLVTSGATFNDMFSGDVLTVATSSGVFSDARAATGKTVSISGITLGGTDAGNYTLTTSTASTTATID
ncbi:YDG domain-containing protein, partial [Sandarakinorhabdus limnophila]|uniref:YDG domain-containing protein n=1 Tax=Sandarakinorhabdus limnophila TaxID=210512 RepID=UPI0003B70DDE